MKEKIPEPDMKSRFSISSRSGGLRMFNDRGKKKNGAPHVCGGTAVRRKS